MRKADVLEEMVRAFRQDCKEIFDKVEQAPAGQVIDLVEFEARRMALKRYGQIVNKAVEFRHRGWERKKTAVCQCGHKMRMVSQRLKSIVSVLCVMTFKRRYYRCDKCGASLVPFDEEMGIAQRFSGGAVRLMSLCGAKESFQQASKHLKELAELNVDGRTVRSKTMQTAHQIKHAQQSGRPAVGDGSPPFAGEVRVYLTMDATKVNTCEDGWRDVKLSAIYDQSNTLKHFVAGLYQSKEFGLIVRQHASAIGVWNALEKIGAGDGADWIWRQLQVNFPILDHHVLDYYHLCENIYKAAWKLYPEGSANGHRWAKAKMKMVRNKGGRQLIKSLKGSRRRCTNITGRDAIDALLGYLTKHENRMDYPELEAKAVRIGTGPLESACKNVIGKRLKGRGMRWRVDNAQAMACLRAMMSSTGCWDAFWKTRAAA